MLKKSIIRTLLSTPRIGGRKANLPAAYGGSQAALPTATTSKGGALTNPPTPNPYQQPSPPETAGAVAPHINPIPQAAPAPNAQQPEQYFYTYTIEQQPIRLRVWQRHTSSRNPARGLAALVRLAMLAAVVFLGLPVLLGDEKAAIILQHAKAKALATVQEVLKATSRP